MCHFFQARDYLHFIQLIAQGPIIQQSVEELVYWAEDKK